MASRPKLIALALLRAVGGFRLARRLTRRGLRILCYHGIALADEHAFQGKLFMHPDTFRARMALLRERGYVVLSLDEAIEALAAGRLPEGAVVITIDDGWVGTGRHAFAVLQAFGWPATLYVATRAVLEEEPIPEVLSRYVVWRARGRHVDLARVDPRLSGHHDLGDPVAAERVIDSMWELIRGESEPARRRALVARLASEAGVDLGALKRARLIELMTMSELADATAHGVDVQLHSHTHTLPQDDRDGVVREIEQNRQALAGIAHRPLQHLCYPSGEFHPRQFAWLRSLGIRSATTCERGFAYRTSEPLALPRLLDSEDYSLLEFEAEMSGVMEALRRLRGRVPQQQGQAA